MAPTLKLLAAYADHPTEGYPEELRLGQGLIGQCARDARRLILTNLPRSVVPIRSGLFRSKPKNAVVLPVLFEGQVKAVIELAALTPFTDLQLSFLEQLTTSIGIVLNSIEATMQTEGLLTQSQELAGELQTQQRELQQTNDQLEQKAQQLAERNVEVEAKNQEIEQARRALEEKAAELALTSKYKSEFLANMSHELRTPLNSILILGQQLTENPDGNLTDKQVEFARTIHGAGTDLLNLISDILDLSKIESGTVSVEAEELFFSALMDTVARPFRHEAENRNLSFEVQMTPDLGRSIITDSKRLQQVLKNLLSNAFKFTAQGAVRLKVYPADERLEPQPSGAEARAAGGRLRGVGHRHRHPGREAEDHLRGLPAGGRRHQPQVRRHRPRPRHQPRAGEPARRRDRRCARRLAKARPSPSTCRSPTWARRWPAVLPRADAPALPAGFAPLVRTETSEVVADDRRDIEPGDAVLLIVEDDPHYARIMADLARDSGFKVLVAMRGADALALAREHQPTAVSLDVFLPDMLGWTVLSHLKQDPATRHIPVQIVTLDEDKQHGLARGAFSFLNKPTTTEGLEEALARIKNFAAPRRRRLLVVEDNPGRTADRHRAAGPRRHRHRDRRLGRRGARAACAPTRPTAWCST